MHIAIIAAIARNRVIGRRGKVPWHIPEDLARFKKLTMGHTLLMGRRTYESIGRPLSGRRAIVVASRPIAGVDVVSTPDDAVRMVAPSGTLFVIGGVRLFERFLPSAELLYLTRVDLIPEGDTCFPPFEHLLEGSYRLVWREEHPGFTFEDYERKTVH